jgi:hypothetical protein
MVQVVSIAIVVVAGMIVLALVPYFQAARSSQTTPVAEAAAEADAQPADEAGAQPDAVAQAAVDEQNTQPEAAAQPEATEQPEIVEQIETTGLAASIAQPEITAQPEATLEPVVTPQPEATPQSTDQPLVEDLLQSNEAGFIVTANAVLASPGVLPKVSDPPVLPEDTQAPAALTLAPMSVLARDYRQGASIVPYGGMPIPALIQHDYKTPVATLYGRDISVWTSGCGADTVSMVVDYLTGETKQTPYTLFRWAAENGLYKGSGLDHDALTAMASLYGVSSRWIAPDENAILGALSAGHPVIAHMGPGAFTNNGHYIVLRGVAPDGTIYVNDPAKLENCYQTYPLDQIIQESKTDDPFMICAGPT